MSRKHRSKDEHTLCAFGFFAVVSLATVLLSTQCQSEEATATSEAAEAVVKTIAAPVAASLDRFSFLAPRSKSHLILELSQLKQNLQRSVSPVVDDTKPGPTNLRLQTLMPNEPDFPSMPSATTVEKFPWQLESVTRRTRSWTPAVALRLEQISPTATIRLAEKFASAKAAWPPAEIALLAIKDEKVLELYARAIGGKWNFVHGYRVLAASGAAGPKLIRGDKQVPEGVYGITFLNPNSRYHVSMRVNYPNAFDREMAKKDGRKDLGGDIMIHGKNSSAGCLAVGDEAAEELFLLASMVGLPNVKLIIAPADFRSKGVPVVEQGQPPWLPTLYAEVASAMSEFSKPAAPSLLSFFTN